MENVIHNIKTGTHTDKKEYKGLVGLDYARKLAEDNEKKTGNKTYVRRILDGTDQFNGNDRHHYSFDVVEIVDVG